MRAHMEVHLRNTHKCAFCKIIFPRARERMNHENEVHLKKSEDGNIVCPCGFKCVSKYRMAKHRTAVHRSQLQENFNCKKCSKSFKTRNECELHKKEHIERTPCEFCGRMIPKGNMNNHIKERHTTHKCETEGCGLEFSTVQKYRYHIKYGHEVKISVCPQCQAEFSNEPKMREHIERQHEKIFECQVPGCKHKTVIKYRLARHYIKSKLHKNLLPEERVKFIGLLNINSKICKTIDQYYLTGIGEPPRAKLLSVLP
jgi:hypothetical protein